MPNDDSLICVICEGPIDWQRRPDGTVFWKYGHNADPVADGKCCTKCNETLVVPERIALAYKVKNPDYVKP